MAHITSTLAASAGIKAILDQGQDPRVYRTGLASRFGLTLEIIDTLITLAGTPRIVDSETVAQERIADEHRHAHSAAGRTWNHEEE